VKLKEIEIMKKVQGFSEDGDDMNWTVECPECQKTIKYEGYFDSEDFNECKCGCIFKTERVWIDNSRYVE
jgi:hypothetical protein